MTSRWCRGRSPLNESPTATALPNTFEDGYLPTLIDRGTIFRMGVWSGTKGTLFPHYATITKEVEAASDHAAIYADINL